MTEIAEKTDINVVGARLNDTTLPLKDRFRALFTLRNMGGHESVDYIVTCFKDTSVLLKHELAYCLGQMQDKYAITMLNNILEDEKRDVIVRHEAGEALGAIGCPESLVVLKKFAKHHKQEIAETCELAVSKINWQINKSDDEPIKSQNPYRSVDPAHPCDITNIAELRTSLLDESLPLYERYRSMFALRNIGSVECIHVLCEGFKCEKSALFRHEIAYVLGQTQHPASVTHLINRLHDNREHPMVRHECAEALGAIATDECTQTLTEYLTDEERVVRESCVVALDISEYELSTQFQYADALHHISPKKQKLDVDNV